MSEVDDNTHKLTAAMMVLGTQGNLSLQEIVDLADVPWEEFSGIFASLYEHHLEQQGVEASALIQDRGFTSSMAYMCAIFMFAGHIIGQGDQIDVDELHTRMSEVAREALSGLAPQQRPRPRTRPSSRRPRGGGR